MSIRLALIFLGLLCVYLWQSSAGRGKPSSLLGKPMLERSDQVRVSRIILRENHKELELIRTSRQQWLIGGAESFPANTRRVYSLLDDLVAREYAWVAARTSELAAELGIDGTRTIELELEDGAKLQWDMGRAGRLGGAFARLKGFQGEIVYGLSGDINYSANPSDWESTSLMQRLLSDLKKLTVTKGPNTWSIERQDASNEFLIAGSSPFAESDQRSLQGWLQDFWTLQFDARIRGNQKEFQESPVVGHLWMSFSNGDSVDFEVTRSASLPYGRILMRVLSSNQDRADLFEFVLRPGSGIDKVVKGLGWRRSAVRTARFPDPQIQTW